MLEAHVRIGVIADGYDQARGMLHSRVDPDKQFYVFDMMEPLRPVVDRADFILQQNGVCRLSSELARRVVHGVNFELRAAG